MANSPGRTSRTVAGTGIGGASEKVRRRSISSVGSPKLTSLDAGSNTAPFAPHSVRYPIPDSTTYEFGALPGTEFPLAEAQHNVCELFTNRNCVSVRLNTLSGSTRYPAQHAIRLKVCRQDCSSRSGTDSTRTRGRQPAVAIKDHETSKVQGAIVVFGIHDVDSHIEDASHIIVDPRYRGGDVTGISVAHQVCWHLRYGMWMHRNCRRCH